jgi:hypothetical protein
VLFSAFQQAPENTLILVSMFNLVTLSMCELVKEDVHQHVIAVVLSFFVFCAQVNVPFVDGKRPITRGYIHPSQLGEHLVQLFIQLVDLGIFKGRERLGSVLNIPKYPNTGHKKRNTGKKMNA